MEASWELRRWHGRCHTGAKEVQGMHERWCGGPGGWRIGKGVVQGCTKGQTGRTGMEHGSGKQGCRTDAMRWSSHAELRRSCASVCEWPVLGKLRGTGCCVNLNNLWLNLSGFSIAEDVRESWKGWLLDCGGATVHRNGPKFVKFPVPSHGAQLLDTFCKLAHSRYIVSKMAAL